MSLQPLQTRLKLEFTAAGKDVSESLLPDLISFSYDDKETNEVDEISIVLKDEKGKWAGRWKPDGGEVIKAYINAGEVNKKGKKLYCGKFYVDNLSVSGAPRTFTLKAVSVPLNKSIRRRLKSEKWESKNLKEIGEEIAKNHKMKFIFDSKENPHYDRQDQSRESDMKFLSRLCEEAGLSLKVSDEKIIIFDQSYYEKKKPIKTLTLGVSDILSWNFESSQSETYKTCTITYKDPKKTSYNKDLEKTKGGGVLTYTYTAPDAEENGQEFSIKKRAKSLDEAKRIAKAKLRALNLRRTTGSLTVIGDTALIAGVVIKCKGFGSFDGNFIIENASHSLSSSGYTTSVNLRRVNNAY